MSVEFLRVCSFLLMLLPPDRNPVGEPLGPDRARLLVTQLERTGTLTVPIKGGHILIQAAAVKNGRLLDAMVIARHDGAETTFTSTAKEMEIGIHNGRLRMRVAECRVNRSDESTEIVLDSAIFEFDLDESARKPTPQHFGPPIWLPEILAGPFECLRGPRACSPFHLSL